jgi:Sulfotransferase family
MASAAACWTVKRYVVEIVVLEVLFVLCIAARFLVRPGGTVVGESRNETIGSSYRSHNRSNQLGTPSLAVEAETHNLSSQPTSFDIQGLVESVVPRAYPLWNNLTVALPCPPAEEGWTSHRVQHATTRTGILYVKVPKTGSSTASSVNLRLASRIYQKRTEAAKSSESAGNRSQSSPSPQEVCRSRSMHSPAHRIEYGRRDRMRSVLWSVVRDPAARAVSQYFHFYVSRFGHNASDDSAFRKFLWENRESLPSVQVRYLAFDEVAHLENSTADDPVEVRRSLRLPNRWRGRSPPKAPSPLPAVSVETIRSILRGYDFVGVSERMDESLVALQLLLGLETSDMLHMRYDAKRTALESRQVQ